MKNCNQKFHLVTVFGSLLAFQFALAEIDISCMVPFIDSGAKPGTKNCFEVCNKYSNWKNTGDWDTCAAMLGCKEYCETNIPRYIAEKLTWLGHMTDADKVLIQKYPADAVKVFFSKKTAEESTARFFENNFRNDESDAFRHFVWAGLLTKELGGEKAKLFLDAHEKSKEVKKSETEMDLFNNKKGMDFAGKLIKQDNFNLKQLEKEGLELLRKEKLKVLLKNGNIPKWKEKY